MKSKYNLPFLQKLLLILIILPILSVTIFAQSTRYVNINVIGGNNNGTTWGNAYNSLQTALVAAQSGDQIWVAKGTYLPSADASGATSPSNSRTKTFVMKNGVAIYGGFSGNGTETQLSDRDFKNNLTYLSGDIGTISVSTDNCYHVVLNNFTQDIRLTNTAILDGFTISDGYADGTYPDFDGGGMYNQYASPTLNNLIFISNYALKNGGGMVNFNSSAPSINNGIFSGNTANTGGGMNNQTSSNAILTNVSFTGNSATTSGGAMYNYNIVSPNLKNVVFLSNNADLGGGMYNEQRASPILSNCAFSGNRARTDGGGMYNINNSNPQIKNSIIWGNGIEITNITNSFPVYTKSVIKNKNLGSGVFAGNTDPLFVRQPFLYDSPSAGDLRLQLCSPAINLGDNTGVTDKDLDGNNRIFENIVDLGAYEFQQNRNPTNVSVSSTVICNKTNINLLATCANGMVTWYNAATNGIVLGTGSSFSYTPSVGVNQTFYASCVNTTCESDRIATSNTLTVNALPIPTASAVSPICAGTTLNLNSGNTGISTSNAYAWTGVNSFTSTAQNPTIPNATTASTGTYQVLITNDKGCTAMATTTAIVNALPIPTASAVSPICAGTTLNLNSGNTGISTSNAYAWTGVNSFTSTGQNPSILNATTAATGTYQVIITNDKGCTAMATTSATVNALPIPTASAVSPICAGTTLNLNSGNTGISTSNAYAWTGVNSFTSTAQNPTILNATTASTGTYQVIITNDKGCTAMATTTAIVNALPIPTASAVSPICAGTTLNLNSGNTGISTSNAYAWTGVNSFTSTGQNPSILNATTAATGTYQVIITNDKGCTAMATTTAIVNALPIPTASAVSPICAGTTLNLNSGNTGISTSNAYAWTGVNSFTSTGQNPSILNATTAATGTYQVIITNDKGCTAMATTTAIVNALPIPTASAVSPICAGTTLNLNSGNTGISTSNAYAWTGVNSFTSTGQNPSILNATTAATGTYQVIITNDKGCTAMATTTAIVNALPIPTASAVSPICAGTTLNLNSGNTGISTSNAYAWTGVNSFTSTGQNPSILNATTAATGTYQVIITNDKGCTAMATTTAIVNALPIPTASAVSPICAGTTLNLNSGNTGISTSNAYAWTGVNSFTSTGQNPSILNATTAATGTYQVIITNDKGCTAMATTSATVNALPIPTASAVSPICAGTTLNLNSGNTGISTSNAYAWTGVNSFTSTAQNPTILNATTAATGTYQVVITNDKGCTAMAITSATINPTPEMPTIQADTQIIFGGSVSLTATGCLSIGGVLKWYQTSDNQLVTMPVSPTATIQYYVKCELTANGITCISPKSNDVIVTVLQPQPPLLTGATICLGNSVTLAATGCSGNFGSYVLKWYQNSTDALVVMPILPTSNTDYYAKCEQTFNSVTAISGKSNVVTVTVLNPLTPVATGGTIYKGNSIALNATGCTGAGFTIRWYQTSDNGLVTMPVSPAVTTQYYAKCEQTANSVNCLSIKSNDVTVMVVNRIFVDITKIAAPIQNGNSWATAYGNLQTGLAAAAAVVVSAPAEVWVAQGTYKPTPTTTRTIYFNMPNNVKVYGGFAGTENALNNRNFRTNTTILSADIGTVNLASDNSYHVVIFDGSTSNNTVLDGFTITGGYGNFDPQKLTNINSPLATPPTTTTIETGGGIVVQNAGMPTIANCLIVNNAAVMGGGIYASDASIPKIITCKVMSNQATFGAGVYFQNGSNGSLNNTLISGNRGTGVIYNNRSNPTINNCTIAGNGGYNGGIFNSASQPIIKNSILWNNSTPFNDTQSVITYSTIQGGYIGIGNLNYDPQFVSPITDGLSPTLNGDYHLQGSSIVIDRGDNAGIGLTDKDLDENLRRFNGGTVDMGAYEFQGAATSNIIISAQTGDWEINSTWVGFKIPTLCDVVIIDSNHIVTLNTVGVAKSIQYRETGQIKFKTNLAQLNIGCN